MKKSTFKELCEVFRKHNDDYDVKEQFRDSNALKGVVVFSEDNWKEHYSIESRSYLFTSDNKFFIGNLCGSSIYAETLDKTDDIRLDYYLSQWKIDYFYILEDNR